MRIKVPFLIIFALAWSSICSGNEDFKNILFPSKITHVNKSEFKVSLDSLMQLIAPGFNKFSGLKLILYKGKPIFSENGSGRLYESTFEFNNLKRLDSTLYSGYCYGARILVYNDTIFSIGGYGFWKLNGTIRYFNQTTKEWSFYPTDREIPFAEGINSFTHYDYNRGLLYLLYEESSNETVYPKESQKKKGIKISILNLKDKTWGPFEVSVDSKWADHIGEFTEVMSGPQGLILYTKKVSSLLYINFEENSIYQVPEEFRIQKVQLFNSLNNYISFWEKDSLVIYNYGNDGAIKIPLLKTKKLGPIFSETSTRNKFKIEHKWVDYILITSLLVLLTITINKRTNKKHNVENHIKNNSQANTKSYSSKEFFQLLNQDEKQIFLLILNNSLVEKRTSIDEINKTLGIQSRPYKIQNNIRADVISSINKTYGAYNEISEEIIIRNQAAFDKRFKEYQINERFLKKLHELANKTSNSTE